MFEHDVRVVDHLEPAIVSVLSLIVKVELIHGLAWTSQALNHIQPHFLID